MVVADTSQRASSPGILSLEEAWATSAPCKIPVTTAMLVAPEVAEEKAARTEDDVEETSPSFADEDVGATSGAVAMRETKIAEKAAPTSGDKGKPKKAFGMVGCEEALPRQSLGSLLATGCVFEENLDMLVFDIGADTPKCLVVVEAVATDLANFGAGEGAVHMSIVDYLDQLGGAGMTVASESRVVTVTQATEAESSRDDNATQISCVADDEHADTIGDLTRDGKHSETLSDTNESADMTKQTEIDVSLNVEGQQIFMPSDDTTCADSECVTACKIEVAATTQALRTIDIEHGGAGRGVIVVDADSTNYGFSEDASKTFTSKPADAARESLDASKETSTTQVDVSFDIESASAFSFGDVVGLSGAKEIILGEASENVNTKPSIYGKFARAMGQSRECVQQSMETDCSQTRDFMLAVNAVAQEVMDMELVESSGGEQISDSFDETRSEAAGSSQKATMKDTLARCGEFDHQSNSCDVGDADAFIGPPLPIVELTESKVKLAHEHKTAHTAVSDVDRAHAKDVAQQPHHASLAKLKDVVAGIECGQTFEGTYPIDTRLVDSACGASEKHCSAIVDAFLEGTVGEVTDVKGESLKQAKKDELFATRAGVEDSSDDGHLDRVRAASRTHDSVAQFLQTEIGVSFDHKATTVFEADSYASITHGGLVAEGGVMPCTIGGKLAIAPRDKLEASDDIDVMDVVLDQCESCAEDAEELARGDADDLSEADKPLVVKADLSGVTVAHTVTEIRYLIEAACDKECTKESNQFVAMDTVAGESMEGNEPHRTSFTVFGKDMETSFVKSEAAKESERTEQFLTDFADVEESSDATSVRDVEAASEIRGSVTKSEVDLGTETQRAMRCTDGTSKGASDSIVQRPREMSEAKFEGGAGETQSTHSSQCSSDIRVEIAGLASEANEVEHYVDYGNSSEKSSCSTNDTHAIDPSNIQEASDYADISEVVVGKGGELSRASSILDVAGVHDATLFALCEAPEEAKADKSSVVGTAQTHASDFPDVTVVETVTDTRDSINAVYDSTCATISDVLVAGNKTPCKSTEGNLPSGGGSENTFDGGDEAALGVATDAIVEIDKIDVRPDNRVDVAQSSATTVARIAEEVGEVCVPAAEIEKKEIEMSNGSVSDSVDADVALQKACESSMVEERIAGSNTHIKTSDGLGGLDALCSSAVGVGVGIAGAVSDSGYTVASDTSGQSNAAATPRYQTRPRLSAQTGLGPAIPLNRLSALQGGTANGGGGRARHCLTARGHSCNQVHYLPAGFGNAWYQRWAAGLRTTATPSVPVKQTTMASDRWDSSTLI
eukprot:TRINITY_DN13250_c1_g1_i1.p1 TRINITY_DN13250_c1_g1~~TRINITY_DN13250_c1_g1_i1.p1  ORF type:complete len:1521 (+),score=291.97 TRINITY_DN13250_c1_g1_i1:651-4565(+)